VNGLDQLRRYHSTGELAWRYDFWAEDPPQALDMAPALLNAHAVLVGDAGGTLTLHDDNANPVVDSTPSSRVGKFLFTTHVPEGGFFGTHVLVARLSWTVAMRPMEARLLEWFEVVDGDGAPVHRPAYQVVLTLAPHEGAGGAR